MNKDKLKLVVFGGLFAIPFVPLFVSGALFFPFITTKAFVWRIVVEIVFAAWVLWALLEPSVRPKKSPILYAVAAFLGIIFLADLCGVDFVRSFWSNFERMEGFVTLLHLGLFGVVIASVFDERNWRRWWNTSFFVSFLVVLYSLAQLAGLKTINQGGVRVDGTFGNAIYLAIYLVFHIFMLLFYLLKEKKGSGARWLYGILIALELVILYHTATRGAILGLLGGLLIFAFLNLRNKEQPWVRKGSLGVIALVAIAVAGFFSMRHSAFVRESPVLNRFASISLADVQTEGRYFVWRMAWDGFKEKPILGWGQENFNYVFQEHYSAAMYNLEPWFDRAHNIFLDWAVSGGALGLLAYLALYGALLWSIWRGGFSPLERSALTALVAAYFFNNIFVFDNLGSYIFFFAILSYVHSRTGKVWSLAGVKRETVNYVAAPVAAALLLVTLYYVNVKPLKANVALINGFAVAQQKDYAAAVSSFEKAYRAESYLGRTEVVEQIAANAVLILSGPLPMEEKNAFYLFANQAIAANADRFENDARIQLSAGSYFTSVNLMEEGLARLEKAQTLMPQKQVVYFEIGSAYINEKKYAEALAAFKTAYDLAPGYTEAKVIYLIGAIYAKDSVLEAKLIQELDQHTYVFDDRIVSAYYASGNIAHARAILNERKELDPQNAATYDTYLKQLDSAR
jgi:O-antigen ligase